MTWSKKDRRIVEKNYLTMKDADISLQLLPHKSTRAITEARRRWGFKKYPNWTEEELTTLKQHRTLKTCNELSLDLLSNKSSASIETRCFLLRIVKVPRWSIEELKILDDTYFKGLAECKLLLNRSSHAITKMASKRNLKYTPKTQRV